MSRHTKLLAGQCNAAGHFILFLNGEKLIKPLLDQPNPDEQEPKINHE